MHSAKQAGYMELKAAVKDASCEIVDVPGGISQERGCCNLYEREDENVTEFRCGVCKHMKLDPESADFNEPRSDDDTSTPPFPTYARATTLVGSHSKTPFLQSMKPRQVKIQSKALGRAISRSQRAKPSSYRYG